MPSEGYQPSAPIYYRRPSVTAVRKGPPGPGFRQRPGSGFYRPVKGPPGPGFRPGTGTAPPPFNPEGAVSDLLAAIAADYDAALAEARGSGGGGGGGGGGNPYARDIAEAEEMLADVLANRTALSDVYDEYRFAIDPYAQEAIDSASRIVSENQAAFGQLSKNQQGGIEGSYNRAEAAIAEMAALIGAEETTAGVQADATETEARALATAVAEGANTRQLQKLTQTAAVTQAQADKALDEGEIGRRSELLDIEFQGMEEQVRDRITQLREAAAQAAAAASSRRRAAAGARAEELALLEQERFQALNINPHEAGEATALAYLGREGANLDYNKQQLVLSTLSNAISQQVTPNGVDRWLSSNDIRLLPAEKNLVKGAMRAYVSGMRFQQDKDRGVRAPTGQRGGSSSAGRQ